MLFAENSRICDNFRVSYKVDRHNLLQSNNTYVFILGTVGARRVPFAQVVDGGPPG